MAEVFKIVAIIERPGVRNGKFTVVNEIVMAPEKETAFNVETLKAAYRKAKIRVDWAFD